MQVKATHQTCQKPKVWQQVTHISPYKPHCEFLLIAALQARAAYLFDYTVVLVSVPIEAQLADPLKVIGRGAVSLTQPLNHITRVHLNGDQCHHLQRMHRYSNVVLLRMDAHTPA